MTDTKIIKEFLKFAKEKNTTLRREGKDWEWDGDCEHEVTTFAELYPFEEDALIKEFSESR